MKKLFLFAVYGLISSYVLKLTNPIDDHVANYHKL